MSLKGDVSGVLEFLNSVYGSDAVSKVFSDSMWMPPNQKDKPDEEQEPEDRVTAALVGSSIPAYTNSELCPKCEAYERVFIQANYVCPACKV